MFIGFSRFCQTVFQDGCTKCLLAKSKSSSCRTSFSNIWNCQSFNFYYSSESAMVPYCGFNLNFPDD